MLTLRVGYERVCIEQVEGSYEVRMMTQLGKKYPLWVGAQGKAILAYLRDLETEEVLTCLRTAGAKILASSQALNLKKFSKDLAEIRKRGFAVSFGERVMSAAAEQPRSWAIALTRAHFSRPIRPVLAMAPSLCPIRMR
jgi:DNA-binding IclR family transcriptional regulator